MVYRNDAGHHRLRGQAARTRRRAQRLRFNQEKPERLTHYLFRYPAKFHPPAVRTLLERHSRPGDWVLDPFCGSGTCLVEASALGRNSIGTDVDPLAVFVSRIKTHRLDPAALRRSATRILRRSKQLRRAESEYEDRQFNDLSERSYRYALLRYQLRVPALPNIEHWFRRYVIVDLARLRKAILSLDVPRTHRDFFLLCFASIIRGASNADPVPVSGLEVTSHMLDKEAAGRIVDPFALFDRALSRSLDDMEEFVSKTNPRVGARSLWADAVELTSRVRDKVDVVITSPPYHNAVDYYRRHTLEMYWLDLVASHEDRLLLLPRYIGRPKIPQSHRFVSTGEHLSTLAKRWERRIRSHSHERANAFKHYMVAMRRSLDEVATLLRTGGEAIFVLGKSSWNGGEIPTTRLFEELGAGAFSLADSYWYPLKNRYMSYSRQNGANINREHVLVLRKH